MSKNIYGNQIHRYDLQLRCFHLLLPWRLSFRWESYVGNEGSFSLLSTPNEISQNIKPMDCHGSSSSCLSIPFSHDSWNIGPQRLPLQEKHGTHLRALLSLNPLWASTFVAWFMPSSTPPDNGDTLLSLPVSHWPSIYTIHSERVWSAVTIMRSWGPTNIAPPPLFLPRLLLHCLPLELNSTSSIFINISCSCFIPPSHVAYIRTCLWPHNSKEHSWFV